MNEKIIIITALLSLALGLSFIGRYLYLDYKAKQEKSFLIIGLGLLAFWFFGGSTFLVIAILLFALILLKGCF
jgi:hypothetical protein